MIPDDLRPVLNATLDRLVPRDEYPAFSETSAMASLARLATTHHAPQWVDVLPRALKAIRAKSESVYGRSFESLTGSEQDAVLGDMDLPEADLSWMRPAVSDFGALVRVAAEAYYGGADSPGAHEVGFAAGPKRSSGREDAEHVLPTTPFGRIRDGYDVIVIGAGAGGGTAARVLTEAGASVLLVERGSSLTSSDISRDHLANHRIPLYGHNTGPAAGKRVLVQTDGSESLVHQPFDARWHNNAMTVGGGTRVYQGMAWRFHPDDFQLASKLGVPAGSSISDWPIRYEDLEPFYTRAEWELGVAGTSRAHVAQGWRSRDYPLPPLPESAEARLLRAGANQLGLSTGPVPLLINTRPRDGRAQCVRCGECVGFACPVDAKNGSHNVTIPLAVGTGLCDLVAETRASKILTDRGGRVTGARLHDAQTGAQRDVRAAHVVVAAGAIESARLMLLSATETQPDGLGNAHDQVGRNLQGHLYTGAFGLFDETIRDSDGPGVSIATCDYLYPGDGTLGGVLANEVVKLPIIHWYWALPPDARGWGAETKRLMRDGYGRTSHVFGPIQEVPRADNRVTLSKRHKDSLGLPVVRLEGHLHPDSVRAAVAHRGRAERWLEAAGARQVWSHPVSAALTGGQHQAGTLRMGNDPSTSVVDPYGRVHGHDNLWVMDASLHVTNGGFNPVLTIYALAYYCASNLAHGSR